MDTDLRAGFASYTFSNLFADFTKLLKDEIMKVFGVSDEMRKLDRLILKVNDVIDTLETSYAASPTNILKKHAWVEEANRLKYDVDEYLEDISIQLGVCKGDSNILNALLSTFKLDAPHKISQHVKKLEELIAEIDNTFVIELLNLKVAKPNLRKHSSYMISSPRYEELMISRVDQREKIIKILFREDVSAICVAGMAGIGKTAFAESILNNKEVMDAYPLRIWVSVMEGFDVVRIIRAIIESISATNCKLTELWTLQSMLRCMVEGKTIIVVLDDFCTEDYDDWEKLSAPFEKSEKSKFIITTRNSKVGRVVGAEIFQLPVLLDEECYKILSERPFVKNQLQNLKGFGIQLAKKCKGIALVAKIMGDLLQCLPDEEWEWILKCELWDLPQYKDFIIPVLLESYCSLPSHLKKCFCYCSLFPPGYGFEMNSLVLLWLAEGLIQPVQNRRLEDLGKDYFNELVSRSFFNLADENHVQIKLYKIHEFTLNLALYVTSGIYKRVEGDFYSSLDKVRHLSVCHDSAHSSMNLKVFPSCERLKTFLLCPARNAFVCEQISDLLGKFKILRVLNLNSGGITEVPDKISDLKHLRYLNLANNNISSLPLSLCELSWLQTLVLTNCPLDCLPENFSRLSELRHLVFDVRGQLRRMPIHFGFLVNLQTLDAFIVEEDEGYTIEELKDLTSLGGSICITALENVNGKSAADSALLKMKQWISKLELEWRGCKNGNDQDEVLTGLQPHENLKELIVRNYSGTSFPPWFTDRTTCFLKVIHLQRCHECTILPPLGKLQFLEHLSVESIPKLKKIHADFAGVDDFQSLKSLSFIDMVQLDGWDCLGSLAMYQLRDLTFSRCPNLMAIPILGKLNSLQNLKVSGCDALGILPEFSGNLASIQSLIIHGCPILISRYTIWEWSKVKTIPVVEFDGKKMSTQKDES
ncbi:putative disease resistance protein RGA3 [Capsicum annuum]|uniref:putative disease resistance protein RGA3 n=1 Tax=Capsicum annuum TaxID=4072 RepID=UPI001FB0CD94|nr:putative disease resistance protein RGA3 [Capsicum annuum]